MPLESYNAFLESDGVKALIDSYDERLPLYRAACLAIYSDIKNINEQRGWLSSIRCRVKSKNSLFYKIFTDLVKPIEDCKI